MNCPKCGVVIHLDSQSKEIDSAFNETKFGKIPAEFFRCKGCGLVRPELWWETLQMDVEMEIKFPEDAAEIIPEELSGKQEAPWGD